MAEVLKFTPKGLYIGGEWRPAAGDHLMDSINPATGETLAAVPRAGEADVDRAVRAAQRGYAEWGRMSLKERAASLESLAKRIEAHVEELAALDAHDSGNAIVGMRGDVTASVEAIRYYAGLMREIKGETFSMGPNHLNLTRRQPYGVVGKINPFNHPFRFCAEKAAAPLAAGNAVVIKQPEQAPLSGLRFGELCEGLFPDGVVNVLTGDGATGSALVRHPEVPRIGFIGSVETGRTIAREAADGLKVLTLELGGKNPMVIFPDADPEMAATLALKGMNLNRQGQSCSSTSRIFVHEDVHDAVVDRLVSAARALPIGLPWRDGVEVGPVVSREQYDKVLGFIESGRREGAALLTGGRGPDDASLEDGYFIAPTVFDRVSADMRIAREEIFGPVMSVMPWRDYDDMIEQANGVVYGLTAAIVTNDLSRAMDTAERLECGYVWINSSGRYLGAPYGGWKHSGVGREEDLDELISYTRVKNINMRWTRPA